MRDLNLAREPFVNARPVRRVGLLLLLLGSALLAANAVLYWKHFSGEGKTRNRSQDLAQAVAAEEAEVVRLQAEIAARDIDSLNRRARFVNNEIDRRRFGWSRLFDQIAEVQPGDVRLISLLPQFGEERRGRRRQERSADAEVNLTLRGVSRTGDAILEFIDALFEHPAFGDPDLSRESRRQDGLVDFLLSVRYLSGLAEQEPGSDGTLNGVGVQDDGEAEEAGAGDSQGVAE